MANNSNIEGKGFDSRTTEEQREIARQGGIASGEARRKKKLLSDLINNEFEKIEEGKIYNIVGKIQEFPHGSNKFNILIERIILANNFNEEEFIIQIENQDSHIEYLINTIAIIDLKIVMVLVKKIQFIIFTHIILIINIII